MNQVLRWFSCGVGLAALTACSNLAALQSGAGTHDSAASARPSRMETTKTQPHGRNSASVAGLSSPVQASAGGTAAQEARLIGLDGDQLRDLLGEPSEERQQAPGKLWRFRYARTCTVDILLYPDVQTQTFRSLNYEVTGDDGSDKGKRRCAAQLQSWAGRR
jgi:hypothetical protein